MSATCYLRLHVTLDLDLLEHGSGSSSRNLGLSGMCVVRQVAGQDRIAIIVPAEALPQFYRAVGLCLEEGQGGASSAQRPL